MSIDQKFFLKRLLLVIDGSQESDSATEYALRLAAKLGSELHVAYVVDTATMDYLQQMRIFVSEERAELEESIRAKGHSYLKRAELLAKSAGIAVTTEILHGRFSKVVVAYVRDAQIDGVIVGGKRGIYRDKDISTVERELLLELSPVPVTLVKE